MTSPRVLIANRGEIACRVIRTLDRMGLPSVAIHSEADAGALHVRMASEAVPIGPAPVAESYGSIERVLAAAKASGATAVHPGYGLLSENAEFAQACEDAGIAFIGPTPEQIRAFGLKHRARELAERAGVPVCPGTELLATPEDARAAALEIGYPVLLKATAGGGGIGMASCHDAAELERAFAGVARLAGSHFGAGGVFLERWVERARHIEVQIFGDGEGRVLALGERDCSSQRRRQKVIEETPAPGLDDATRARLWDAAVRLAEGVRYRSAGTVEFLYDSDAGDFFFLEVNARLQVEHGVTEAVTGLDLVEWMVRLALGERGFLDAPPPTPRGHAIQARVYAEDPAQDFRPSTGTLTKVALPGGVRVDGWVEAGTEVTPFYDPLLVKLVAHGDDRAAAIERLDAALAGTRLDGLETNVDYLRQVLATEAFRAGGVDTRFLATLDYRPATVEVLSPGTFSSVQDVPGRLGYWNVGVPPSGPMDPLAFRIANRIVGNREEAPGLELTVTGPTLRFHGAAVIALTGADMGARLDGEPIAPWTAVEVPAGATLVLGAIEGPGCRGYLALRGGLDVPGYLGSASTFTLGRFGGHGGRVLATGDVLHPIPADGEGSFATEAPLAPAEAAALAPGYARSWDIGVLDGPQGAPDFFTPDDIAELYAAEWEVHFHSDRTGVRLVGPRPRWARADGGEAGLHPSNLHDNAYAVGAVDFTGDMPVILGPDGPSLGGFVCPVVVAHAERWKLGQLRPGDKLRFRSLGDDEAAARARDQDRAVAERLPGIDGPRLDLPERAPAPTVLYSDPATGTRPEVTFRRAGDRYVLVEFGPMVLDLDLRVRVEELRRAIEARRAPGGDLEAVVDLTPGVRSLQVHYDARRLSQDELLRILAEAEEALPDPEDVVLPTRTVWLPLSWDDPATREAVEKYMRVVRDDAPWCSTASGHARNLEFIQRINGLDSVDDVKRIVFDARYVVLGLGDVYLGAPVATPLDPRHRLVTTKYNPARTWTPENAVGIGGAYLCIYGMEGPGGYQFVGRTVPVWNTYRVTEDFREGTPWLLRFFDQIRFYEVSAEELLDLRRAVRDGTHRLRIEEGTFSLAEHHDFVASIADEAAAFKRRQQAAFEAERARWEASGEREAVERLLAAGIAGGASEETIELPEGAELVGAPLGAQVWRIHVEEGQRVESGAELVVLEAMKTETPVVAPAAGRVVRVLCAERQVVSAGAPLFAIVPEAPA